MIVNSISVAHTNQRPQMRHNVFNNTAQPQFTGLHSTIEQKTSGHKTRAILAAILLGAAAFFATSCTPPVNPTPIEEPTDPTIPTDTQSPVQTRILSLAASLGLTSSTKNITSVQYYDSNDDTKHSLTLNTEESTDNELVFDGTSVDQFFGTTNYVRHRITKTSDDAIIVKQYVTDDGLPASATTSWASSKSYKYALNADASGVEKYLLEQDGTVKKLLATIYPETSTSLSAITPEENSYQISDITITTEN